MKVQLKIFRFDPEKDDEPYFQNFTVEADSTDRLLDCLNRIRWTQDPTLSYRMSCGHGICGSDGMTINGKATLACQKLVKEFHPNEEILVEPLKFFTVIKDLIVDLEPFFEREESIHPEGKISMNPVEETKEHLQMPQDRQLFEDGIKCIMCACCVSACPVNLDEDPDYIGPAAIVRAHRYIFDSRIRNPKQRLELMDKPHGVWSCKNYYKCTQVCPKEIQVTKGILEIKRKILDNLRSQKRKHS